MEPARVRRVVVVAVLVACGLVVILLAHDRDGAGTRSDSALSGRDVSTSISVVGGDLQVTCGHGLSWSTLAMAQGLPGVLEPGVGRSALADLLADPELGAELRQGVLFDGVDTDYRVLREEGDEIVLGVGQWSDQGPGDLAYDLSITNDGDHWVYSGGGFCAELRPLIPRSQAWTELTHAYSDPSSPSSLAVRVTDDSCGASAQHPQDAGAFLNKPRIVETDKTVTIYWTVDAGDPSVVCISDATLDATVDLAKPLGTRDVLDGSTFPPRPIH